LSERQRFGGTVVVVVDEVVVSGTVVVVDEVLTGLLSTSESACRAALSCDIPTATHASPLRHVTPRRMNVIPFAGNVPVKTFQLVPSHCSPE